MSLDAKGLEAAAKALEKSSGDSEECCPEIGGCGGTHTDCWYRSRAADTIRAYSAAVLPPDESEAAKAVAAGRAAATPDPPTDERRPWPIAPDTVMPPRRQPVRWGSRADDPPTEIHDDPGKTKAYLAGLAAGRTEAAAASPDKRLREAEAALEVAAQLMRDIPDAAICEGGWHNRAFGWLAAHDRRLAAADREKPERPSWPEGLEPCPDPDADEWPAPPVSAGSDGEDRPDE